MNNTVLVNMQSNKKIQRKLNKTFGKCVGDIEISEFKFISNTTFLEEIETDKIKSVEHCYDGTLIRLYFDETWKTATNNCSDANKASWENVVSFGSEFSKVAEPLIDYSQLNKNYTYYFILQLVNNRIITPITKNGIIHIETFDNESKTPVEYFIPSVGTPEKFLSVEPRVITDFIRNGMWFIPGLIVKTEGGRRLYLETYAYTEIRVLKGNMVNRGKNWQLAEGLHSSFYRLLQIIKSGQIKEFLIYFPEYSNNVKQITEDIWKLAFVIHREYLNLKVFKNITEPKEEYKTFIYFAHKKYLNDRKPILRDDIVQLILNCPMDKLMTALKYKSI